MESSSLTATENKRLSNVYVIDYFVSCRFNVIKQGLSSQPPNYSESFDFLRQGSEVGVQGMVSWGWV